ncbi:MAG: N-6 DNA methylase [Pirellulales bacterium]|nr:N-6 DNA methylase [Pirellulales bacterium]
MARHKSPLRLLHERMRWPAREAILSPSGSGPRVLVELAKRKIEDAIRRSAEDAPDVHVGLLTKNPKSDNTEAPLAVICEFAGAVSDRTLAFCHRLAWNFARSPLLVTVEPHRVRTWTCCEPPPEGDFLGGAEITEAELPLQDNLSPSQQAAHALHWVRLASGDFYRRFPDRFRRDGRADFALLQELKSVHKRLRNQELADDRIHDLLARVVFSQFLFDRKDSDGQAAINPALLQRLHKEGLLARIHKELGSILKDYDEAYRFFHWLNDKFNGDLFPGKGRTPKEREAEWQEEMNEVKPQHLQTLAGFVSGKWRGQQRTLWRLYSFDVIPLEFISSIYEEFVTAKGAHYTPGYLVDFMLDEVLPWGGSEWDLKILDPACGSGIFLVKAYQRLIERWKNAHPGERPSTPLLKRLLERNLFGLDIDPHAVRVASFSLYLTMCDELDPKTYLRSTKFPLLRDERLIHADFFQEDTGGFSTEQDGPTYDLVIGNAPWGKGTETKPATQWARDPDHLWPIANKQVGTLFLAKAATLTKPDGRVSMIQPASSLLFNRSGPANRFREQLFSRFKVEEVVNLSTLRFELFEGATSPPCIVTLRPTEPDDEPLLYISPKQVKEAGGAEVAESQYAIVIEPHDISRIWPEEAATEPLVWTALAWGGRRDLAFIRRLRGERSLKQLDDKKIIYRRKGIVRGDRLKRQPLLLGRRILESPDFPVNSFLQLEALRLPVNDDDCTESASSTTMKPFDLPQLILKKAWQLTSSRVKAVMTKADSHTGGIVCTQSYVSVHAPHEYEAWLQSACLSYNSVLAVYFLLLTSGRLASYRPEALVDEILAVPMPEPEIGILEGLDTPEEVDARVHRAFDLKDAEWLLVKDLCEYTLPDFKGDETSPGRQPTERIQRCTQAAKSEPHLSAYCDFFARVLKAGFGQDKRVSATIFQDAADAPLPVRLVAIHLDWAREKDVVVERIDSAELCDRLLELDQKWLQTGGPLRGGIFYQRVALVYSEYVHEGRSIPTVYIIKPDRIRYWTRSAALRDADEVASDVQLWRQHAQRGGRKRK